MLVAEQWKPGCDSGSGGPKGPAGRSAAHHQNRLAKRENPAIPHFRRPLAGSAAVATAAAEERQLAILECHAKGSGEIQRSSTSCWSEDHSSSSQHAHLEKGPLQGGLKRAYDGCAAVSEDLGKIQRPQEEIRGRAGGGEDAEQRCSQELRIAGHLAWITFGSPQLVGLQLRIHPGPAVLGAQS